MNESNGVMLMRLFNTYVYERCETVVYIYTSEKNFNKGKYFAKFSKKWWDTPYVIKEASNVH